jgi:hypothetical protein
MFRRLLAFWGVALFLCAAGCTAKPPPPDPAEQDKSRTVQDEVRAVQAMWREHLKGRLTDSSATRTVRVGKMVATLITFRQCLAEVKNAMSPGNSPLVGRIEDLDRDAQCWRINTDTESRAGSYFACVDLAGNVVLMWYGPEG